MEDSHDTRNMILSELIDKMHGRMADKMYPDAVEPVAKETDPEEKLDMPKADSLEAVDTAPEGDDMSDEDIDELLKGI